MWGMGVGEGGGDRVAQGIGWSRGNYLGGGEGVAVLYLEIWQYMYLPNPILLIATDTC
jgi:hypothetical protein